MSTIAMIPARMGSTRLKLKNLALLDGKPLMAYALQAAKASKVFDRVILNCDSELMGEIAQEYGVEVYVRPQKLGSSTTKSDDVVYDFMCQYPSDSLAWVNTTSPLQTPDEIRGVVNYFEQENLDTLVTVRNEQVHCVMGGNPVNYDPDVPFEQTQSLMPVQRFVYSVMMWRTESFMQNYRVRHHAFFSGKVGFYPVSKLSSVIVKTAEDLAMAEALWRGTKSRTSFNVLYDQAAQKVGM